jgi:hypothetical protein
MMMMIVIALILGVVALNLFLLYRRGIRERMALTEYVQFLFLHTNVYEDHRVKFSEYLKSTSASSSPKRGDQAAASVTNLAMSGLSQFFLTNAAARDAIAKEGGQ